MGIQRRIQTQIVNGVTVLTFVDPKLTNAHAISELGEELFALVENDGVKNLVLNFVGVTFLTSAVMNKLVTLKRRIEDVKGGLVLFGLAPDVLGIFVSVPYRGKFKIKESIEEALTEFKKVA